MSARSGWLTCPLRRLSFLERTDDPHDLPTLGEGSCGGDRKSHG